MPANNADEVRIEQRREKVWELRVLGQSSRQIASQVGVSHVTVCADIDAVLERTKAENDNAAQAHRAIQVARLDKAMTRLLPLLDVDDAATMMAAMDRLDKLERRRAELLGLDAPEKHSHDVNATMAATNADAARLVRETFGGNGGKAPSGSGSGA